MLHAKIESFHGKEIRLNVDGFLALFIILKGRFFTDLIQLAFF